MKLSIDTGICPPKVIRSEDKWSRDASTSGSVVNDLSRGVHMRIVTDSSPATPHCPNCLAHAWPSSLRSGEYAAICGSRYDEVSGMLSAPTPACMEIESLRTQLSAALRPRLIA